MLLFAVDGRGTGTTGVADTDAELLVEEALDEALPVEDAVDADEEDEAEPPLRLNNPE